MKIKKSGKFWIIIVLLFGTCYGVGQMFRRHGKGVECDISRSIKFGNKWYSVSIKEIDIEE